MDGINTFLEIIINLEKVIALGLTIGGLWFVLFRVLARLGTGLQSRKISVIADSAEYTPLKKDLKDTGVFRENNIRRLKPEDVDTPEKAAAELSDESLLIFIYTAPPQKEDQSAEAEALRKRQKLLLGNILEKKNPKAGLIVYAKTNLEEMYTTAGNVSNTVIVNTKGRILNDLLNLMMTTSLSRWNLASVIKNVD